MVLKGKGPRPGKILRPRKVPGKITKYSNPEKTQDRKNTQTQKRTDTEKILRPA
jgi:hypothetical protein